ncbi:MAG: TIGR03546 family protein [Treponema sp.]|nr:TIGR03546 family protein [Treponema sp.]
MIKVVAKLVVALNGNIKKTQIAAGIAWGLLLGLIPVGNFFWIVLLLVSFFFNHHHGLMIGFMLLFKLLSPLFAPALDLLGWEILHIEALQPLFTSMYNMPFVPFTKFNNTLVTGGLIAGIVLFVPTYFVLLPIINVYRNTLAPKIRNLKIVKTITKFPLFSVIDKAITSMGE